jgi:hypothetical protein
VQIFCAYCVSIRKPASITSDTKMMEPTTERAPRSKSPQSAFEPDHAGRRINPQEGSGIIATLVKQNVSGRPVGPTSIFLESACAIAASQVEQSLSDIFPDSMRPIKSDGIRFLNFDNAKAADAFDSEHMARDFREAALLDRQGQGPASRDPAGAQPPAPASPSASGRAFASLRVAHSP